MRIELDFALGVKMGMQEAREPASTKKGPSESGKEQERRATEGNACRGKRVTKYAPRRNPVSPGQVHK